MPSNGIFDPNSAIANHVKSTGHHFDFKNTKTIFRTNDRHKRHLVESAVISNGSVVNQNSGFSPHVELLTCSILSMLKM